MGDTLVGKTFIINSLLGNSFKDCQGLQTLGIENFIDNFVINDRIYKFKILDTAGTKVYRKISNSYIPYSDAIILVFSFDRRNSFDELKDFINMIREQINIEETVKFILGNKNDINEKEREISREEGELFAEQNNCEYFEVSAKTGYNIREVFFQLYIDIYNLKVLKEKKFLSKFNKNINNILYKYINV